MPKSSVLMGAIVMRYKAFEIQNFKGIKSTKVDLSTLTGANVFCLVGLNESGKTTLLEAIHTFSPDFRSGKLVQASSGTDKERAESRVPRHQIASFTGETVVSAIVSLNNDDRQEISSYLTSEHDLVIDSSSLPDEIKMTRADIFERGDYLRTEKRLDVEVDVRTKSQRKMRRPTKGDIDCLWDAIWNHTPDIAYYPTFIFDFPERIYITPRPGKYDSFYSAVFADILAVDGQGYTLDDIRRRIRNEKFAISWVDFFPKWMSGDDRGKVQQIIDRASAAVTKGVFGKWNKIFGENVKGKEISIEFDVEEGRVYNKDSKTYTPSEKHDVYIWFEIKDGTRRFKVNDRSLGFRWFFSFLLFTQFRVSRRSSRNVLFLFDEPASNLHAAAQQKLIESFPEIADGDNMLMYTTHSHYMVDPSWLEQTFIVTNRSEVPGDSIVESATLDDESLDIQAHRYRKFVNDHPSETSYFQPIVDRLNVVPSKFDYNLPSVVLEGKSDFYILSYAMRLLGAKPLRLLPGTGSGTFSALIALGVGWGVKFLFMLDSDAAGAKEKDRYALDLGARSDALVHISSFVADAREIEDMLDAGAKAVISEAIGVSGKLSKKQILQFFQECLAKDRLIPLGSYFESRAKALLAGLEKRLSEL